LSAPSEGDEIVADYASLGLTLGRHPLALLRPRLRQMRLSTAADIHALADGTPARAAGIVTCRQRPGTAKGVIFVTLEDETGYTNVIVWNRLVEEQRRELLGASLLGVHGIVQKEGRNRTPGGAPAGGSFAATGTARHEFPGLPLTKKAPSRWRLFQCETARQPGYDPASWAGGRPRHGQQSQTKKPDHKGRAFPFRGCLTMSYFGFGRRFTA
jgi:hypothetical protein